MRLVISYAAARLSIVGISYLSIAQAWVLPEDLRLTPSSDAQVVLQPDDRAASASGRMVGVPADRFEVEMWAKCEARAHAQKCDVDGQFVLSCTETTPFDVGYQPGEPSLAFFLAAVLIFDYRLFAGTTNSVGRDYPG